MIRINITFEGLFLCFVLVNRTINQANFQRDLNADGSDYTARTILGSQMLLLPTLATIGFKSLLLLPMFLLKIVLLTTMNFVSSSLSLLLSVFVAVRNYFGGYKSASAQDHDPNEKIVSVEYEYRPSDVQFAIARPQGATSSRDNVAYGGEYATKKTQPAEHGASSSAADVKSS